MAATCNGGQNVGILATVAASRQRARLHQLQVHYPNLLGRAWAHQKIPRQ